MREIRAIIRPNRLEKLRQALREIPSFPGMTVLKAEGFTAPSAMLKRTDAEELTDFSPKLLLCILAPEDVADQIQALIIEHCRTGLVGDGLVWSVKLETQKRIRDGSDLLA